MLLRIERSTEGRRYSQNPTYSKYPEDYVLGGPIRGQARLLDKCGGTSSSAMWVPRSTNQSRLLPANPAEKLIMNLGCVALCLPSNSTAAPKFFLPVPMLCYSNGGLFKLPDMVPSASQGGIARLFGPNPRASPCGHGPTGQNRANAPWHDCP